MQIKPFRSYLMAGILIDGLKVESSEEGQCYFFF